MLMRVGALPVAVMFFAGLLGCVSADVYRVKEKEVQTLFRTNEELQKQNKSLSAEKTGLEMRAGEMNKENEGLNNQIAKRNEEIVYLKNLTVKLEKDGEGLRVRVEKLGAKISDLNKENQRLAALTRPENLLRTLGERLADLEKQMESLAGENEKLKNNQVIARSAEKIEGENGENTGQATGEKSLAVSVSAGQKAEEGNQDEQVREEQEQPLLSDRETASASDKP